VERAKEHGLQRLLAEQLEPTDNYEFLSELIPTASEEAAKRIADDRPGPEELAIQADAVRLLAKRLPAEQYELLAMYYGLNGRMPLTVREIAQALCEDKMAILRKIKLALESARCAIARYRPPCLTPYIVGA
jgi:DNA-directed RNA polymerase sigma subunit (sigma70/sigma32)